jgi:Flp pilus assembly protein TadD
MYHAPPPLPGKNPKDLDILHSLASAHLMFGQHDKAIALLRLGYWIDPANLKTIELIAHAAFRANETENALLAIDQLESLGGKVSKALQLRRRYARLGPQDDGASGS